MRFLQLALSVAACAALDAGCRTNIATPIAAVSVSARGFVVLLSSPHEPSPQKVVPVRLHPSDIERVVSAEAHTFLQLLVDIDMGTPLLPPDALRRAFCDDDDDDDDEGVGEGEIALESVRVNAATLERDDGADERLGALELAAGVAEARGAALAAAFAKVGVSIDAEGAARLVRRHAIDAAGALDRAAFSAALAEARIDLAGTSDSGVIGATFELVSRDGRSVEASAFLALALSLRHDAPLRFDPEFWEQPSVLEIDDALLEFPLARMYDDAKKLLMPESPPPSEPDAFRPSEHF